MNFHVIFDFGRLRLEWERRSCVLMAWSGPRWWSLQNLGDGWTLETAKGFGPFLSRQEVEAEEATA